MPVLARTLESAGFSTILVTNMPFWAEKVGTPRTLAVEFPFGHTLGRPHDAEQQRRVIEGALDVLEGAREPGALVHSAEVWPIARSEALKDWQPAEASPIMEVMAPRILAIMRERRRQKDDRY